MSSSGVNLENFLIPLKEIYLATENFHPKHQIGDGGFGAVYRGQLSERWQNRTAAIKRLDPTSYQGEHEFRNEVEMISSFHHQNIIPFIGYCDEGNEMIIVYEYAIHGSLDHHLQDPNKRRGITWRQRLKICISAARGLKYLHSGLGEDSRVIHRDVKSANVLLDDNLEAKICDFGLSRLGPRNQPHTKVYTNAAGTHFYLDPIYHESGILQKESDVYSFGVILFEMLSGTLVYYERSIGDDKPRTLINLVRRYYDEGLDKLIDPHIRDQIDSRSFHTFKEIAYRCISFNLKERPTMDRIIERIQEALDIQENVDDLIECVMKDIGFSQGKPVAAFTIYKCLLHWKSFEAERTNVFNRLIRIIRSAIKNRDNNYHMAYWLSNASALLFLIQRSLKPDDASSVRKPPPPTSLFGRMTMGFRSSQSSVSLDAAAAALGVVSQVEAKYPALLFKQQLTAYVEKMYRIIRDNLKKELGSLLALCIQAPRAYKGVLRFGRSIGKPYQSNHWQGIVDCLNAFLNTLKENFVPPIIVQKIFTIIFSFINVRLFNSLLLRRECCSFSNGEYVKAGLAELELWCCQAKEEYAVSAWDELKHLRQAVGFLVTHEKHRISYDHITNEICPILSVQQLHRICTLYWDDKYATKSVSEDVISSMRIPMREYSNNGVRNSFLLDDNSSIPFSVDDLSSSLQVKDFANVKPAAELVKNPAFHFLHE